MCPLQLGHASLAVAVLLCAVALGTPRRRVASRASLTLGVPSVVQERGTGSPAVVLEAGYRSSARIWSEDLHQSGAPPMVLSWPLSPAVAPMIDQGGETLLNDNVRQSRSDPVAMPRTGPGRRCLTSNTAPRRKRSLRRPSLGGLFVRLYASTYP